MRLKYFLIILHTIVAFTGFSQITEEQEELIETAEDYFYEGRYKEAMPLYSQLLSLYPTEAIYSFYYGACLVENNKEIDKSIKYLSYASRKLTDQPLVFYYLGRAYHLSYQFDKAIQQYQKFQAKSNSKQAKEKQAEREINICNNGLDLVKYTSSLIVLENKKTKESNFQYSYKLDDIGGKLVLKPDQFKTKADLKQNAKELIFISDSGMVFFSSLGENKKGDRDIFWTNKNDNGDFLPSQNLGDIINTPFDEDYPFLKADGKTLYFCSKGHNTMGGYDIFRSVFDSISQTWSSPENLDFPTNTPYDDLLYVVDASDNLAYFASNRESQEEKLNIYKIQVDHNPKERSVNSVEEIIKIAKLEVTPLADNNLQKSDTNQAIATTEVADFKEQGPKTNFSFEEVYDKNINSPEAYTTVLRKDIKLLKKSLEETQAKNILANNIAHQKLGQLREIQSQIERIESNSGPKALINNTEYKQKLKKATEINAQAQIAVEIANKLSSEIKTRERELNITELLLNDSANNSTQELVQNINANRIFLQKNNQSYLSLTNKKREKEKEKLQKEKNVEAQKNVVEKTVQNLNLLITDYQEAEKQNNQADMTVIRKELIDDKRNVIKQNKLLKNDELELEKIKEEIRFLDQLNGELSSSENQKLASTNQTFDQNLITKNAKALNTEVEQMNKKHQAFEIENIFNQATEDILGKPDLIADNKDTEISNNPNEELKTETLNIEEKQTIEDSSKLIAENKTNETDTLNSTESNKPDVTKKEMVEVSLINVKSLQARRLFFDAKRQQQISDSLIHMAQEKSQRINYIPDIEQQDIVKNEIEELNQLSIIKSKQAKQSYIKAQKIEEAYIAQNPSDSIIEHFIDKGLMSYETGDDENPDYIEYKKAAFTEHYYQKVLNENSVKASMNQRLLDNSNLPEERKTQIENELSIIEKSNEKAHAAIQKAKDTQESMKEALANKIEVLPQSKEEILVASTHLELGPNIKLNKAQQKSNKSIAKKREQAKEIASTYKQSLENLKLLEDSLNQTEDIDLREELSYDIEDTKEDIWVNFRKANELNQFSNMEERANLNKLLAEKRKYSDSDKASIAYLYEKESEVLEEKANYLRNNNNPNSSFENATISNLEKANLYELTANNRKKAALEIYASISESTDSELLANNNSENKPEALNEEESVEKEEKPISELLPGEEERLAEYKKLYAQAEDKQVRADNNYRDLETEKLALERAYLEKDKKKQEAKIAEIEIKTKNKYQEAYRTHLLANRKKKELYSEKIEASMANSNDNNNKAIAKQYMLDADFYFAEAEKIEADSNLNIFDLRAQHKQRLSLEKQALNAQELAFTALNKTPESDFLTSSGFIKIEPIEQNEKPIDPNIVQKVQTQRILDKINITSNEAKRLSKTDKLKDDKAQLEQEYLANKAEVDLLSDSLTKVTDAKVWKKMDSKISKLEEKSLSYLFSIATTSEPIHYERYMIYKNRVQEYRIKGKSEKAVQGRTLEKEANKAFRKAQNLRSRSFEVVSVDKAYEMLQEAQNLEVSALDKMEKAYTIYLDLKPLEEDVAKYIAENTDTNTVDEFGYNLIESEGEVEAYETPEIEEVVAVTNNDTLNQFTAENIDSVNYQIPVDTLLAEQTQPVDTIFIEDTNINITDTIQNEEILAENTEPSNEINDETNNEEAVSIEEANAMITEANNNTNEVNTPEPPQEEEEKTPTETSPVNENNINHTTNPQSDSQTNATIIYNPDNGKPAFKMLSTSAYNNDNPIPINRQLPNGIVYKIQIGAFTKPIPQNSFKGLTPITGETRQNSKYVRYFVGLFDTYEAADVALPHIQRSGYRDAFIVAYRNGERIAIYIAKREDSSQQDYKDIAQTESQEVLKIINENAEQTLGNKATTELEPINPSVNLTEVSTTMYTVQIGVYRRHIAHERLYNLLPLYNDITKSGLIRYTVGQFVDYNQAIQRRNEIRQKGIKDAFVTAYRNGERISIRTARAELANINANNTNSTATVNNETSDNVVNNNTLTETNITESPTVETPSFNTENLHYCVQIGAFSNTVPVSVVSSFIQLSKLDELNHFEISNGQTVYTIGNFKSLNRAKLLKQDLIENGITDAFIIAFDGQKKVPITEAQKVLQP